MFEKAFEWLASRSSLRFKLYREARLNYEAFIYEMGVPFDLLAAEHHKKAATDERLIAAEPSYRQAIELSREVNAIEDVATGLYQLGMLLHLQGRFAEATECFSASLRILEDLAQLDRSKQAVISGCHYHLGVIALRRAHLTEAKRRLRRSLDIDSVIGDLQGIALCKSALNQCGAVSDDHKLTGEEYLDANDISRSTDNAARNDLSRGAEEARLTVSAAEAKGKHAYGADTPREEDSTSAVPGPPKKTANGQNPVSQPYGYRHDVIWLLSHSVAANDIVMSQLEKLSRELTRKVFVSRVAFGGANADQATPAALEYDARLCAAILVIEREGLKNENFLYWANWCIKNVAAKEDFRLFLCLDDMTTEEIQARAELPHESPGNRLLADLVDTVQIPQPPTAEQLRYLLRSYLWDFDSIRAIALWRRLYLWIRVFIGRVACYTQVGCSLMLGAAVTAAFFSSSKFITSLTSLFPMSILEKVIVVVFAGSDFVAARVTAVNPAIVAVIAGIVLFTLLTIPLFFLFQGVIAANSLLKKDKRLVWLLVLFALLGPATVGLPQRVGAGNAWIMLGIVAGILIDIARRSGHQSQRSGVSLEKAMIAAEVHGLSARITELAEGRPVDPLTCPLFPANAPKVFISYTRSSDWSRKHALALHKELHRIGCESFLDRESIGEGSSWRRELNRRIADANVFISVLDEKAVARKWVAAEMITALVGKRFTGLPDVIVLVKPGLTQSKSNGWLSIFQAVINRPDASPQDGQPRLITLKDSTLQTVVSGLSSYRYKTPSVFPPLLSSLLSVLTIPAAAVGTFGPMFGIPAAIFALLQNWAKVDSSAFLSSWGLLVPAYILCGFWLGFVARLTAASRFEVQRGNPMVLTKVNAFAVIGFASILAVWSSQVPALVIGWAMALCCIGWLLGSSFIDRVAQEKPDLRRQNN